jgi:diacylglycerol kinase
MKRRQKQSLVMSFRHAFEGLRFVVQSERNARIHILAALAVIALGAWLDIDRLEWALIGAAIGMVFAGEMLNTVVEITVDLAMPRQHALAKCAKDVAAGAILVSAVTASSIGLLVLGPPLLAQLGWI